MLALAKTDAPAGVRVLDLLDGAGIHAAKLLVGFGAEVTRIELPDGRCDSLFVHCWASTTRRGA